MPRLLDNRRRRFPSTRMREQAGISLRSLSPMRPDQQPEPVMVPKRPCRLDRCFNEPASPKLYEPSSPTRPFKGRGRLSFRFTSNPGLPPHGRRESSVNPRGEIPVDPPPPRARTEISMAQPRAVMAISVAPPPPARREISVRLSGPGKWEPNGQWLRSLGHGCFGRLRRFNARRNPRPPTSPRRHLLQTKTSGTRPRTGRRRVHRSERGLGGNSARSRRNGGTVRPVRPRNQ
jgi:hypothetical protein